MSRTLRLVDRVRLAIETGAPLPLIQGADGEAPAPPASLADAAAASAARVDSELPLPPAPGDVPPPAAPPAEGAPAAPETDFWNDDATPDLGNIPYRDGKKLEADIKRAREAFRPYREAFGTFDDAQRDALLEAAPDLGTDLVTFAQAARTMHPEDRAWFTDVMTLAQSNPVQAAEMLAGAAAMLRGESTPDPSIDPFTPGGEPQQPPGDDAPMTRAEFLAEMQRRETEAEDRRARDDFMAGFTTKARELGYDPQATTEADVLRWNSLLDAASRTGGDIDKAHEAVAAWEQAAIDRFVAAKQADANRPGAPVDTGTPPVQAETELSPFEEGRARMLARLDGSLGPDPRRRGEE
jgi:hypothetical protein